MITQADKRVSLSVIQAEVFIFFQKHRRRVSKTKIQSGVCGCHPGSPLHSASVEKPCPPAVFPRLTPIGF